MAGNITGRVGSWQTMLTTELNSLAANTGKLQVTGTNAAYDNSISTNLYQLGDFELQVTFGTAPTAGLTVDLYLIPLSSTGGTTYADGSATIQPQTLYVGSWTLRNINTLHILYLRDVELPPGQFIVAILSNSNQTMAASGNTVKFLPHGEAYT